jgi:hypothetical protein
MRDVKNAGLVEPLVMHIHNCHDRCKMANHYDSVRVTRRSQYTPCGDVKDAGLVEPLVIHIHNCHDRCKMANHYDTTGLTLFNEMLSTSARQSVSSPCLIRGLSLPSASSAPRGIPVIASFQNSRPPPCWLTSHDCHSRRCVPGGIVLLRVSPKGAGSRCADRKRQADLSVSLPLSQRSTDKSSQQQRGPSRPQRRYWH